MPTMAQWGSKKWAVSSKQVVALEGLAFSYEQVADENTSTEDKKTTNERGTELFPLSFTTVLHSGAGVDVWAEIQSWKALVTKVNYFYLGGKGVKPGVDLGTRLCFGTIAQTICDYLGVDASTLDGQSVLSDILA